MSLERSSPTPLLLFGLARSIYTQIARLALEEKGVPYVLREVEIFGTEGIPAEHLERHPFGRIPVLQHGRFSLYETSAIARYVDEAFAGPALQPPLPPQRARMNQAIGLMDAYGYRPMVWGVYVQRTRIPLNGGVSDEAEIARSLQASAICLDALEASLEIAPFLAGDCISLADTHAFPMLRCLGITPEGDALLKSHQMLHRWYEAMLTRPSVARTTSQQEAANPS